MATCCFDKISIFMCNGKRRVSVRPKAIEMGFTCLFNSFISQLQLSFPQKTCVDKFTYYMSTCAGPFAAHIIMILARLVEFLSGSHTFLDALYFTNSVPKAPGVLAADGIICFARSVKYNTAAQIQLKDKVPYKSLAGKAFRSRYRVTCLHPYAASYQFKRTNPNPQI